LSLGDKTLLLFVSIARIRSGPMLVRIEIPLHVYEGLVDKCDQSSREHTILKNGAVVRHENPGNAVVVLCEMIEAQKLLILASKTYPEANEHIVRAIAAALKSA
jgi:hypothetical protein